MTKPQTSLTFKPVKTKHDCADEIFAIIVRTMQQFNRKLCRLVMDNGTVVGTSNIHFAEVIAMTDGDFIQPWPNGIRRRTRYTIESSKGENNEGEVKEMQHDQKFKQPKVDNGAVGKSSRDAIDLDANKPLDVQLATTAIDSTDLPPSLMTTKKT